MIICAEPPPFSTGVASYEYMLVSPVPMPLPFVVRYKLSVGTTHKKANQYFKATVHHHQDHGCDHQSAEIAVPVPNLLSPFPSPFPKEQSFHILDR